jgi:hypothetical protein
MAPRARGGRKGRRVRAALLVCLLPPVAAAAQVAPGQAKAVQLAVAATPDDAATIATMRARLRTMVAGNASLAKLEAQYPGIGDHVLQALAPSAVRLVTEQMQASRDRMAALFASALKPADMDAALLLFRSDTGRRLVAASTFAMASRAAVAGTAPLRERLRQGDAAPVTGAEFRSRVLMPAVPQALATLAPDDLARIGRFNASPAGRAWLALQPRMMSLGAEAANEAWRRELPGLTATIQQAGEAYIRSKKDSAR